MFSTVLITSWSLRKSTLWRACPIISPHFCITSNIIRNRLPAQPHHICLQWQTRAYIWETKRQLFLYPWQTWLGSSISLCKYSSLLWGSDSAWIIWPTWNLKLKKKWTQPATEHAKILIVHAWKRGIQIHKMNESDEALDQWLLLQEQKEVQTQMVHFLQPEFTRYSSSI